jgi:hypothetical protein
LVAITKGAIAKPAGPVVIPTTTPPVITPIIIAVIVPHKFF